MFVALLAAAVLVVSPTGPFTSIEDALAVAEAGDTIEVRGGLYGPLVIDKSVTLIGLDGATIDGREAGDVVRITAPDVTLQGFTIRRSGRVLDREHAGVTVLAPRAVVRGNRLEEVLFGVFLKEAPASVVESNEIHGYPYETGRRGDGIRSWYSRDIVVRDNVVSGTRDVIFWFSDGAHIERNHVTDGRYGLHFMYDDGLRATGNTLERNSVGIFAMYSSNVAIEDNLIQQSHGPSGYGIGLKEIANLDVVGNVVVQNRIGISFDTVPHGIDAYARFGDNLVAFNTFGLSFQPSTERVEFVGNSLERNATQVEVRGGGDLLGNTWTDDAGNYWSDYAGYDADGDGVGDLPYEPRSLFASLRDRHPILGFFDHSPASIAIDLAARAVPDLRPSAKVVDTAPLTSPAPPAWFGGMSEAGARWPWMATVLGLVSVATLVSGSLAWVAPRARRIADANVAEPVVHARGITKRYGQVTVLDGFDLEIQPGEGVALWGPNGSGKTTALKCLLGLARAGGEVAIAGIDLRRDGRSARAQTGYVPQVLDLPDLPLRELMMFIARVRGASPTRVEQMLEVVGLVEHARKRPAQLSGGLRQRLGLALALVGEPRVLLLDEPTANLDVESRHVVFEVLRRQRERGVAILFTTHRVDEVVELASRVVTLDGGRISSEEDRSAFVHRFQGHQGALLHVESGAAEAATHVLTRAGFTVETHSDGWITLHGVPLHELVRVLAREDVDILELIPRGEF